MNLQVFAFLAAALAPLALGACYDQHTIEGTSAQYVNVVGKRIKVNVSTTDVPGEYRLLAVRDAIVIDPDPQNERERGREAARRVMETTCHGKSYQVLDERLVQDLNYYVRFRCSG